VCFIPERCLKQKITSAVCVWRFDHQCKGIPANKSLCIEIFAEADVQWSDDNWKTINTTHTQYSGIELFYADIDVSNSSAQQIAFTFYWTKENKREGENFVVKIVAAS
jgi:glucoamylase